MSHARFMAASLGGLLALGGVLGVSGTAHAQRDMEHDDTYEMRARDPRSMAPRFGFAEANIGYGVQFGVIEYLPGTDGPMDWKYPLVHGPTAGGTVGVILAENIGLLLNYEYTWATTPDAEIPGAVDEINGTIDYHTLTAGLRLYVPVGFGRLRAELAGGVVFPFHSRLEFEYSQALSALPEPIVGTGERILNFSVGYGGHAALGYELPIAPGFYLAFNIKYKLFETENSGETTELRNFVVDFAEMPPTAVDRTIVHGDGAERPMTESVQDVRVQLSIGAGF